MREKDQVIVIKNYVLKSFPDIAERIFEDETTLDMDFVENCSHLSGTQELLVRIAHSVWNQDGMINLYETLSRLDSENLQNVIDGLQFLKDGREENG